VDQSAMMAQQIESESQAGTRARKIFAIEEQILNRRAIPRQPAASECATETSFAHSGDNPAAHERAHPHKSISQQT